MASPQAEALKENYRQLREQVIGSGETPSLEDQRTGIGTWRELATVPEGVTISETYAGGSRAYWHDPEGGAQDRVLLYVHGGGYVIGSPQSHENLVSHLAKEIGCRALNLDYRLAPEHPHPAAVDDTTAAYKWLLDQGYAPEHIAIAGDSAGGGLTIAALVSIRENDLPQPAAAMPLSPWADMEGTGDSMTSRAEVDLLVSKDGLSAMVDAFLAGQDPKTPLAAPLYADLTGVAPMYIQVGDEETLLDDATRIAANAQKAGVEVKLDIFPEMQHVFQISVGNVPEATDAVQRLAAWLKPKLGLS